MINAFKDHSIINCDLTFVFIDGRGHEEKGSGIGVVRDALSLFWKEVYVSLLIGENERVPFIRHDYSRSDWEAIARVLLKGYRMCQYPAGIRRCFDVDMRLKQHRDVDNEISTLFQRCAQDVASTL